MKTQKQPALLSSDLSEDKSEYILELFISKNIAFFEGHFKNTPILPGVVQLNWAIEFACQFMCLDKKQIGTIPQVKFTQVILPETHLFLSLKKENNKIKFRYFNGDNTYSLGVINL